MSSFGAWIAPLALLLPAPTPDGAESQSAAQHTPHSEVESTRANEQISGWFSLLAFGDRLDAKQVRIERRVIIRVAPRRTKRRNLNAKLPKRGIPRQLVEKKIGNCVSVSRIAAVQPDKSNRLLLFMRDQSIISANLERACTARDFYSGFYIERSKDGKLCVNRDKLQSRTGAKCKIGRIRQLVSVDA